MPRHVLSGLRPGSISNSSTTWTFTYNADGIRTQKTDGTTVYKYTYNGSTLTQLDVGTNRLFFVYDGTSPTAVVFNNATYYYVTNLQGDIIAILNGSGTKVVEYTYDAWGNILSTTGTLASTLGVLNPLRYRGYVYDAETGLYYLQSRYYDPEMGRFINADVFTATGQRFIGNNMFAYCLNNPINFADYNGQDAVVLFDKDTFGHIGIMAQDEDGTWWHFYWGTEGGLKGIPNRILCFLGVSVEQYSWCVEFNGSATSLKTINESKQYAGQYESMHYFNGDYSNVVNEMKNPSGKYNLYSRNCSQVSFRILALADTEHSELFSQAAEKTIPASANSFIANNKHYYNTPNMFYYKDYSFATIY